jgi:hypothetical protein
MASPYLAPLYLFEQSMFKQQISGMPHLPKWQARPLCDI